MQANFNLEDYFNGQFITQSNTLRQKLKQVKAFVFDWDGVFNNGQKNLEGHSSFSEVDSMGINMMRFSHFLLNNKLPVCAIISGENNQLAASFAKRENFHVNYYKVAHKETALLHLCNQYHISPADILFVFDDVLDLSVAKLAGVRFMIGRKANPLFEKFVVDNRLVDYITQFDGGQNAIREISEIVMALSNNFNLCIEQRMKFGAGYQDYLILRKQVEPELYSSMDNKIIKG